MTPLDREDFRDKYVEWLQRIAANHHATNNRVNDQTTFAPLTKPLNESRVALVTTAGAHLIDQEPFHTSTVAGDASFRLIPDGVDLSSLAFSHAHYDTTSAQKDPNVVLPIVRLQELVGNGRVGAASPIHIGMMGFNPDPTRIAEESGPAVASTLVDAGAEIAVLAPG